MTIIGKIKPLYDIKDELISVEVLMPFLSVQHPTQPSLKTVVENILIDTGFVGALSLPSEKIAALDLPCLGSTSINLADGTEVIYGVFEGKIYWDGFYKSIEIVEIDAEPLLGMTILKGYKLEIEAKPNGNVAITKLP